MESSKAKNHEPFVSILTPVYNGGKYLAECIQSVLDQSYENWEYVIVNNCSTDQSLKIAEEFAEKDSRIRIHDNSDFLPQMENLNHAFRQISPESKYCKVVHADDWLFPECISKMVEVNEEYPSVGIVSAYRLDDKKVGLDGLSYPSNFRSGHEIARRYLMSKGAFFGSPTSILVRSDLIRKRDKVYEESLLATDTIACVDLLQESDFGFVHEVLTFTRRHNMSMTNKHARGDHSFIHAQLYGLLTYGPYFLSDKELQKSLNGQINKYYILLSRNLYQNKSITKFKQQLKILDHLEVEFETGRFFKNFIREVALQLFQFAGIQLRRK